MKLHKVEITNFRCFETLPVVFQPDVNVFVGINGAGKSTILDAIAIALYDIVAANGGGGKRERGWQKVTLRPSDIHMTPGEDEPIRRRRDFVQVRSSVKGFYEVPGYSAKTPDGKQEAFIEWTDHMQFQPPAGFVYDNAKSDRLSPIYGYFRELWQQVRQSEKALIPFPVVAYYRATRRVAEMPKMGDVFGLSLDRQGAFENALDAGAKYQAMCQWFYLRENRELRERDARRKGRQEAAEYELPDLKAIRRALALMLDGVERVFFAENPPSLRAKMRLPDGTADVLELEQLSDGYRNLLALVLDYARRLAQAHPNWEDPLQAPGILLIDEVDLHLHPKWQQTVVPCLQKAFPNVQIILATHSPLVLTTVEARCVQIVEQAKLRPCPAPTYGARVSDVVAEVMGLESLRPPDNRITERVSAMFAAIDRGDIIEAKRARGELGEWAKGYPEPDLVRSDLLIRRLEAQAQRREASKA